MDGQTLIKQIKANRFLPPTGSCILLAISGGADSIALLLLLNELKAEMNWHLSVGHVNHGLRLQAEADARFVEDLVARLRLPFYQQKVRIDKKGLAPEEAARQARQTALLAMAKQANAPYIALAHHADDQAETLLMRLISGTGPSGLAGMRGFSAPWWRPLLDIGGQWLRAFLLAQNQSWREDHTNAQNHFTRNRVRNQLLPLLGKTFNPKVTDALNRLAVICAEEEDCWQAWAERQNCLRQDGNDWLVRIKPHWHMAAQKRYLRFALSKIYDKGQHVLAVHIDQLLALTQNQSGRQQPLPGGWLAWREGEWLALTKNEAYPWQELVLHGPASFYWPAQNTWYSMELCADGQDFSARGQVAWLPYAQIKWPLCLRRPIPGERFQVYKGLGSRKISWLLQDMNLPRRKRARVLVLQDRQDVCWLGPVALHQRVAGQVGPWLRIFPLKET